MASRFWRKFASWPMPCSVCGKHSCAHETPRTSVLIDSDNLDPEIGSGIADRSEQIFADSLENPLRRSLASTTRNSVMKTDMKPKSEDAISPEEQPWRQEVISRVQQHRARRRRRFDPNATLELDFSDEQTSSAALRPAVAKDAEQVVPPPQPARPEMLEMPKIIEFRRPMAIQPVFVPRNRVEEFELAEPVHDTPRILEAPEVEQMDLLPAFNDLELESAKPRMGEEVELPPRSAGLQQRTFACLVDLLIVLVASAAFAMVYLLLVRDLPQLRMVLPATAVVCALLWLVYQYLFLVYSAATPGMQMAQLELCTFQGNPVSLTARRWRALASMLSGCSLGLGYAWALIDEDMLGWHDRITQTHVREVRYQEDGDFSTSEGETL